jgi:hypothetical protein
MMDEYISREEVVEEIKSRISTAENAWESGYNTAMAEIREWIKRIPSADVQPVKHGRWINEGFLNIYCSNCSKTPDGWPTPMQTDYCPNCGARMDGDSE